jgi:hypothetical protein
LTNKSSGAAISGATVTTNTSQTTNTDGIGYYSFSLSNGTYIITASKAGYSDNSTTRAVNGATVSNVNITLTPIQLVTGQILVATNRYVILDDPNSTGATADTGSGFIVPNPANDWGTDNWQGKNTRINATALYIDDSGMPVSGRVINFTLYMPNGTVLTNVSATTDTRGLANFSYDMNDKDYYGKWKVTAANGSAGASTNFIYNWWGCASESANCNGHNANPLEAPVTANSPYLSGRDTITSANSNHQAAGVNCTFCHQSFDGLPGGNTDVNRTSFTSDVHRNIQCDNANCHGSFTTHDTNQLINSCYNSGYHTPANRSDISNKSTLNSSNVATALSLYSINNTAFNATFHTPASTVPCIICHGPMHNITKPDETQRFIRNNNTEDSQCKTCHSSYTEHNSSNTTSGGVNCTLCHSDDVHDIQVFSNSATYINLNRTNPTQADLQNRGNCTNCHQNATFFAALEAQPNATKNYTGRDPPQVAVPLEHSNDPNAGAK